MERLELLKEPFRTAYQNGDSIDYQTNPYSKIGDHSYVEKYGYHSEMHSDCSYSAPGLRGFSLSSYGNWGTVYTSDLNDEGKEIFFNMIEENIIKPWRIRTYTDKGSFDYVDGDGWTTYDKEKGWISCPSPYVDNSEHKSINEISNCECDEVKVGDKVEICSKKDKTTKTCVITEIHELVHPFTLKSVVAVLAEFEIEDQFGNKKRVTRKLKDPTEEEKFRYFNLETKKEIEQFTSKKQK